MKALLVVMAGLGLPGILPTIAVARRCLALAFLAPLVGAGMAAAAAEFELGVGGTLLTWYVVVAVTVNVGVVAWWLAAGRLLPRARTPWRWPVVTGIAVLGAVIVPLTALRAGIILYDGNAIWLTHTLMVSGGHHELLVGLQNVAYRFSNPDYPPLVPAAGALAFALFGRGDMRVAIEVTAMLTACALGVVGAGVAAVGVERAPAAADSRAGPAAGAVCMVGFAVTETYMGYPAVGGYADLLWSAAAVGAVVWGRLVLPRSTQALLIAWICAAVASLTKNEGLTMALAVLVLIALRYRPLTLSWLRRPRERPASRGLPGAAVWPVAPGWARACWVRCRASAARIGLGRWPAALGLHDAFFASSSTESPVSRAHATIPGMAPLLAVAPVAVAVLVAGCCFVRWERQRARLGNPGWLWTACLLYLVMIFATYVLGSPEIQWWLRMSVARTTAFLSCCCTPISPSGWSSRPAVALPNTGPRGARSRPRGSAN